MSQRARDLILLYVLAVIVNGSVAALVDHPGYTDAYYYYNGGKMIAEGRPPTEPYLWNYVYANGELPVPAFGFWQPMPSFLAAVGIVALPFIPPFDAAQVAFVLCIAFLPLEAYWIASQLGERRHALFAGLLGVFSGFYVLYWSLTESFTPYAVSGAAALACVGWGLTGKRRLAWLLAGACAALAHLSRADGPLILMVILLFGARSVGSMRTKVWAAGFSVAGYLLVMLPWLIRNQLEFGAPFPPGGLSALWLTEYNDLFNYPPNLSLERYLSSGLTVILGSKLEALGTNLVSLVAVVNMVFLTPVSVLGLANRWKSPWLTPTLIYGAAMFAAMTIAFPQVGARGGFFHSSGALIPFVFSAAAFGLDDILGWLARRRKWNLQASRQVFGPGLIVIAAFITAFLIIRGIVGLPLSGSIMWNSIDGAYVNIGRALDDTGAPHDAPVMVNSPPAFYYFTGHGGIPLVNGDETMLLRAADDYGVSYLIVDQNVPVSLAHLAGGRPESPRIVLLETFDSANGTTFLYQIEAK